MTEPPVRTPAGSAKSLQLTPIWEEVVRNQRVPPDIGVVEVLREIRGRLLAGEWEVRQHALRVLADVLPVVGELVDAADLQAALVINLGSPAPGVRRAAREALGRLLQHIRNPEEDLLDLLGGCNDENVTLGIIIALPDLLKPLLFPVNGGYILSSHCLTAILTYLVNKVSTPIYRDASVDALLKLRDMCGEVKFQRCLEDISPDPKTLQLLTLNLDDSGIDLKLPRPREVDRDESEDCKAEPTWSDFSDGEETVEKSSIIFRSNPMKREGSSEDIDIGSDGTDDTYTMESIESGKVVLETEIRLSEEKAITMRIMEEDSVDVEDGAEQRFISADGALVMAVVPSSDDDARRTPRRVRFGGEVVKLCTPDSDATDVRIEIQDASGHAVERMVVEKQPRPSQIPLPISPATSLPHAPAESSRVHVSLPDTGHPAPKEAVELSSPCSTPIVPVIEIDSVDRELVVNVSNGSGSRPDEQDLQNIAPQMSSSPTKASESLQGDFKESCPFPDPQPAPADASSPSPLPERPRTASGSRDRLSSSTSGSEVSVSPQKIVPEFSSDIWSWQSIGLMSEEDIDILKNKDDWKEELAVLELLARNLTSDAAQERIQEASEDSVRALLRYLLEYSRPQTAEAALYNVGQIIQILPNSTIQACLPELVSGVCRHAGGSTAVSVKMTAATVLRQLFSRQHPSGILDVLLSHRCLRSPSSKMRENSLLVLLHALMTFPSTTFPLRQLVEEGCRSTADPRRRVRHAALEMLAILAQFLPSQSILECACKYGDERLVSAVSTRLTRRSLASVSADGLVLYALQIPSARRLGHTGPPQGADVDWILAGTGSLSTGSARSRGQLQAAQPARWGTTTADNNVVRQTARENPWTAQKHRTEDKLGWALVPMSDLDEGGYAGSDMGYLQSGVRPLYLQLTAPDDVIRSQRYAVHRVGDAATMEGSIRVLTPSVFRKRPESKPSPWTESRARETETNELRRVDRIINRKISEAPRSVLVAGSPMVHANTPPAALFLPSIHSPERPRQDQFTPTPVPDKPRFVEPAVSAQLINLVSTPQALSQSLPPVTRALDTPSPVRLPPAPSTDSGDTNSLYSEKGEAQNKLFRARESRERGLEQRVSMASAPPAITATTRESSSSSSTADSAALLSHETPHIVAHNGHRDSGPLEVTSISYRSLNESYNQKVKAKRKMLTGNGANGNAGKVEPCGPKFPDTLKPFERPKDGLETCFSQLEAAQWEVSVQGLTSLVRLVRHHPAAASAHIHPLAAALARHIRNLRSQVARAACVVAGEMFTLLKRTLEPELEEVAGALFHRVADTNRFIRQDSNAALDAMVDSIPPQKSVPVILAKGAAHLNAVTRTSAARLLLRLTERLGPEKILSLPRDTRDKMLQSGASLLTEGRLETRSFAKQLFRTWSTHPEFGGIILEAIPANIMRQISKTLSSLRA